MPSSKKRLQAPKHTVVTPWRDRRRKHRHWEVSVYYHDGKRFARIYTDRRRAESFARRERRSPVVRSVRIREVNTEPSATARRGKTRPE